jgi:group I intron endonuclease
MVYVIYKITNKINGRVYIGKTKNFARRLKEHYKNVGVKKHKLYDDILMLGWDNFDVEIIDKGSFKDIDDLEIKYIKQFNSLVEGYNYTAGGEGGDTFSNRDVEAKEVTRVRLSDSHKKDAKKKEKDDKKDLQNKILVEVEEKIDQTQLLIFSDFSYGVLPKKMAQKIIQMGISRNITMAADSQSSSQIGDLLKFSGVSFVTPTEYEARLSLQDYSSGVHEIAKNLLDTVDSDAIAVTMGESGALVLLKTQYGYEMDNLPSLNVSPVDVSGAGDSLLITTALSYATGQANIFQATFLGAIAAAIQVGRVGNRPISKIELKESLLP